jgi:hypothetical protein
MATQWQTGAEGGSATICCVTLPASLDGQLFGSGNDGI